MVNGLRELGIDARELEDGMRIVGGGMTGGCVDSAGDHRIAMALAVAALVAEGETTVQNAECVDISFPGFFDLLETVRA